MEIRQIQGYIQSIYFAVYHDKILLLDGCCKADINQIERFITQELKRPIEQLKAVVVTHMHPDHAGAAALFSPGDCWHPQETKQAPKNS